jgi:hypothetical protein
MLLNSICISLFYQQMHFLLLSNELLLHIMDFMDIQDCVKFRLICSKFNILNYNQLKNKYKNYCINKYTPHIVGSHEIYILNNKSKTTRGYCKNCSLPFYWFTTMAQPCDKNDKLNVCQFKKPHLLKCDCPLRIKKCQHCNNDFYNFQYNVHMNDCQKIINKIDN